jgi:glycosyltransferase involved in cell wall biosynthesis
LDREITNFSDHHPYPVNILAVNAPELGVVWEQRGSHWLQGRYNIGYWCWELPELPRDWYQGFAYFQEVWVASRFVLDGVSRTSPIPVVRIPYCIPNPVLSLPGLGPSSFGLPAGRFTFLFCFDFMSEMERKNPLGLIEAFQQAFGSSRDVLLVIKTSHAHTVPSAYEKLKASTTENVCILDGNLERSALTSLFSLADCFVSLHRSEGFGLALAEAMGLGKPVIATAYSGNLDYMTPTNSFLVRYRLTEITADHGSYRRGGIWAQPDLDHAAELMRFVYHHREEAARIARQGQEDIKHWFSPTAVGQQVCERLEMIQQGTKPS